MKKLVLNNVTKRFGNVVAVNKANIEIDDQEFIVLVGPSGCGKTTTLRMIAGLEDIDKGKIYIKGKLVNNLPPKNRDIAMVFQSYALYPHLNVYQNMAFGLRMRRVPKQEREKVINETAKILGIEALLDRKPRQLSGGQRQRVALGRAIVRNPEVFLFDEPLSNLDAKLRVQMRTELKKLHQRLKATIVYVTHDQVEAMTMGDRIVIMQGGTVQQIGSPLELYDHPINIFVAGFIGSPSMNFLPCSILKENQKYHVYTGDFSLPISDQILKRVQETEEQNFTLGIRPEDIRRKTDDHNNIYAGSIHAKVNVIETLGKEKIIDLLTGKHNLTATVPSDTMAELQKNIELEVNMKKIHLFRTESGEAIC